MSFPVASIRWILCDYCRIWRVCSAEYFSETKQRNDSEWFCCQHPELENCNSARRQGDKNELRIKPLKSLIKKWFEQSWKYLYVFAKINDITDFQFDSWSPFLMPSHPSYLLKFLRQKNPHICPYDDGKLWFFELLSKWLIFHEQWVIGMSVFADPLDRT